MRNYTDNIKTGLSCYNVSTAIKLLRPTKYYGKNHILSEINNFEVM